MISETTSLFSKVKHYVKLSRDLQTYLLGDPEDWGRFQKDFNSTLDRIYQDISKFEMKYKDQPQKLNKIKDRFIKRYRPYFLYGEFIRWSHDIPLGYHGDFKIIDDIYQNAPTTQGFDRLWDNYFQQLDVCDAIRQRKQDMKKIILDCARSCKSQDLRIMSLASGPAREIKELLGEDRNDILSRVTFDCIDFDIRALGYAKKIINDNKVNFMRRNAIRMALKKDIEKEIPYKYDLIYSAGLFDYFNEKLAVKLIVNLKRLLSNCGLMVISNFSGKSNNPSVAWMEWVADWQLIYRPQEEFKSLFLEAGFSSKDLRIIPQQNNVVHYCFASQPKFL